MWQIRGCVLDITDGGSTKWHGDNVMSCNFVMLCVILSCGVMSFCHVVLCHFCHNPVRMSCCEMLYSDMPTAPDVLVCLQLTVDQMKVI